jgi:WD40 repeat protein
VTSVGWSADSTWLAAGLQDGAVDLWSTTREGVRDVAPASGVRKRWEDTFARQPRLDYHGVRVAALHWHPATAHLAVAAQADVRVFDLDVPPVDVPHQGVNCLRWRPHHRPELAAGSMDGELIVVDGTDPRVRRTRSAHAGQVRALAFSPDGTQLVTVAEEGSMMVWPADLLNPRPLRCPVRLAGAVSWSPDGSWLAVGGQGVVAVIDTLSWQVRILIEVDDLVNGLAVDPSSSRVAVATSGSTITVHPVGSGTVFSLDAHLSSVGVVRWADDERLVSGGYDGQAIVWSVPDREPVTTLDAGAGAVWDVAVVADDIVTATAAGRLGLHAMSTGELRCQVACDTALSSCDIGGGLVAAGGSAGVAIFRLPAAAQRPE